MDRAQSEVHPSELMNWRWLSAMHQTLPPFDLTDLKDQHTRLGEGQTRQNMPEVAQAAYICAIQKECAIGDYVSLPNNSI